MVLTSFSMQSQPMVSWNSPSTASVQLQIVSAAKIMKFSFFLSRIDNCHTYTYRNGIDIIFDAVITQDVLEQLVNSFNAAANGIKS